MTQAPPALQCFDIGHETHAGIIDPDTAFWSLVPKDDLAKAIAGGALMEAFLKKRAAFAAEMEMLRFNLKPSAVYFNPTERCNLNCTYCYIPGEMRKNGRHMSKDDLLAALGKLSAYFAKTIPLERKPKIIFHGAEPMLNRKAVFAGIEAFKDAFCFGVQTNATLLDDEAIGFLTHHGVGVGLSLDAHEAEIANKTRSAWNGAGSFEAVISAIASLKGYESFNVICTITKENVHGLTRMVDFLHGHEVPACMLNVIRCTLPGARGIKASDELASKNYIQALERTQELYRRTGRKLIVANFANILISIIAPTARRLMCDISPCGGGRSFFALAADGGVFPCSEFIGLPAFNGGNLFSDSIDDILESPEFKRVTGRKVEDISPCLDCAIRHFCGSPCPAEANEMNGAMNKIGAYCQFYLEQARFAFRLIADRMEEDFLWDGWDEGTVTAFGPQAGIGSSQTDGQKGKARTGLSDKGSC